MTAYHNGSDLIPLTPASELAGMSRNNFNRLCLRRLTPPPTHCVPQRRWSGRQIELWRAGVIQQNKNGLWYEWDADVERWRKLPNQYVDTLPSDAA